LNLDASSVTVYLYFGIVIYRKSINQLINIRLFEGMVWSQLL